MKLLVEACNVATTLAAYINTNKLSADNMPGIVQGYASLVGYLKDFSE